MAKQKTKKNKKGFTLVELLVVLLILGVLVGLAVPRYMQSQKYARARTFAANVREIVSALEIYRTEQATSTTANSLKYPASLSDLSPYFTQPPINPYSGANMLTATSGPAGITYTPTLGNTKYSLTITQADVDDIDGDGNVSEMINVADPTLFTNITVP